MNILCCYANRLASAASLSPRRKGTKKKKVFFLASVLYSFIHLLCSTDFFFFILLHHLFLSLRLLHFDSISYSCFMFLWQKKNKNRNLLRSSLIRILQSLNAVFFFFFAVHSVLFSFVGILSFIQFRLSRFVSMFVFPFFFAVFLLSRFYSKTENISMLPYPKNFSVVRVFFSFFLCSLLLYCRFTQFLLCANVHCAPFAIRIQIHV